jgi:hypothetical protein
VLPAAASLSDLVYKKDLCDECAQVVAETAEYINDVLISIYASKWFALPVAIQQQVGKRFVSTAQRAKFMEGL